MSVFRRPGHDPEQAAAEYVSGDMSRRKRLRFDEHLLECEDCWREVSIGRTGRRVAEAGRELTPSALRESVRAAVAFEVDGSPRPRRLVLLVVSVIAAMVLAGTVASVVLLTRGEQPAPIAAAVNAFRSQRLPLTDTPTVSPPDLGGTGLELAASGRTSLGGLQADLFVYRGTGGERIHLYLSRVPFPVARGAAAPSGQAHGWVATDDGVALLCADEPVSYLLLGDDPARLLQMESTLESALSSIQV
jgi:hypothetical protein